MDKNKLQKKIIFFSAVLCCSVFAFYVNATTETFNSSTTWTAPAGVSSVQVEVFGAGGDSYANHYDPYLCGTYGGGGGGYSKKNSYTVTPGSNYPIVVGTNAGSRTSSFNSAIIGNGGTDSSYADSNGLGGSATGGDINVTGGNGGTPVCSVFNGGGGGGGGSGPSATVGGNASGSNGGSGGTGGVGGGSGGAGGNKLSNGSAGNSPGGGGGGAGTQIPYARADGADGRVILTYTANTAPIISTGPSDGSSSVSTPTPVGNNVTFTATATDSESNNYYLAICKTNAITANANGVPTCTGGNWCISGSTASASQATCSYTTQISDSESNSWYAFACDHNAGSVCSVVSQGSGNSGSPFVIIFNTTPNVPVLVSPANASYTADTTPTLSATYVDSDTGDTGTTNYRIATSAVNCTNNTSIIASGTSSATSTNNETTTYTPSSSIGNDGTYYWCAQNDDGTAQSAWTSMGSFTLDTQAPTTTDNFTNNNTWQNTNQTITLTPTDSGSGIASTKYCTDTNNTCTVSSGSSYTTPITIASEATTYFRYASTDNAGNIQTTVSKIVKIDKTNPTNISILSITPNSSTELTITAQTAQDLLSGLHTTPYYFVETTGNSGATSSSDFQTSTTYIDTGLTANTIYTYKVKAKDTAGNQSDYSTTVSAYTLAPTPTNLTATVNSSQSITLSVDTLTNQTLNSSGYYFERTSNTQKNSGWIQTNTWQDTDPNFSCSGESYTVKYRNQQAQETSTITVTAKPLMCGGGGSGALGFAFSQATLSVIPSLTGNPETANTENSTELIRLQTIIDNLKTQIQAILNKHTPGQVLGANTTTPDMPENTPQTPTTYVFTQTLKLGSKGSEVTMLQNKLKELGFFSTQTPANGYFGKTTQKAVQQFQTAHNIVSKDVYGYGVVGPRTREALNKFK